MCPSSLSAVRTVNGVDCFPNTHWIRMMYMVSLQSGSFYTSVNILWNHYISSVFRFFVIFIASFHQLLFYTYLIVD